MTNSLSIWDSLRIWYKFCKMASICALAGHCATWRRRLPLWRLHIPCLSQSKCNYRMHPWILIVPGFRWSVLSISHVVFPHWRAPCRVTESDKRLETHTPFEFWCFVEFWPITCPSVTANCQLDPRKVKSRPYYRKPNRTARPFWSLNWFRVLRDMKYGQIWHLFGDIQSNFKKWLVLVCKWSPYLAWAFLN